MIRDYLPSQLRFGRSSQPRFPYARENPGPQSATTNFAQKVPFFAVFHEDNLQPPEQFESGPLLDARGLCFGGVDNLSHFILLIEKSGDHQLIW